MSSKLDAEAIAEIREERQKQETLAAKFGVSPSTISRIQRAGRERRISDDTDEDWLPEIAALRDGLIAERDALRAECERLKRENGSLARMYALCEKTLRERTEENNRLEEQANRMAGTLSVPPRQGGPPTASE